MTKKNIHKKKRALLSNIEYIESKITQVASSHPDYRATNPDIKHHFGGGCYVREMRVKAGSVITGKIHRYAGINILLQGHITVLTEHGLTELKAPYIFVSPPGIKRAGRAHTDVIWLNVHATDQTDPAKVEHEVIAQDYIDLKYTPEKLPSDGLTATEEAVLISLLKKTKNQKTLKKCLKILTTSNKNLEKL